MLSLVSGLVIGIVVGWNWAQPSWARDIQFRFVNFVRSSTHKADR